MRWGQFTGLAKKAHKSVTLTGGHLEKPGIRHSVQFITFTETEHFTKEHKMIHSLTKRFCTQGHNSTRYEINAKISLNSSKHVSRLQVDIKKKGKHNTEHYYLYTGCTAYNQKVSLHMFSRRKIHQTFQSLPGIIRSELTSILSPYRQRMHEAAASTHTQYN